MGVEFIDKSGTPRDDAEIIEARDATCKALIRRFAKIPEVYYITIIEALDELLRCRMV